MKTFLTCCLATLATVASAETPEEQADLIFGIEDGNKDGKITLAEVKAVLTDFIDLTIKAGEDEEKVEAAKKKYAFALNLDMFLKADTDDDHSVSREDVLAFIDVINTEKEPKLTSKDCDVMGRMTVEIEWPWLLGLGDADKDGLMSKAEWCGQEPTEHDTEEFDLCDEDKDGKLNRAEAAHCHTRKIRVANGYKPESKDENKEEK